MRMIVHIRPVDDSVGHEESPHCACGPAGQEVYLGAGEQSLGTIYRHHPLVPCREWEASAI
ncbi:hypothetical protein FH608_034630 [Nonomuraea phyllanthi]|uniref:Uncharacterized protein n=1 Tax=Nonomuraea phyllanthi TaxID=2219224 RepID=A0A5C4VXW2_9ACTN|nr:hypothetical protein [Nonomuraea phyllanthi]KAB8190649.1 hypothetical protein FH608_034630 [Nonomuraea phyllanthi]QFY05823.1 hypothetical protein GBF35_03290 [Nonomuraea phyllanthi]